MKLFLVLLLAVFCTSANGLELSEEFLANARSIVADGITQAFLNRMQYGVYTKDGVNGGSPRMSILPNFTDPANFETKDRDLGLDLGAIFKSEGHFKTITPKITGLSKVEDDLVFGTKGGIYVQWTLNVPTAVVSESAYELSLLLHSAGLFPDLPDNKLEVTGNGKLLGSISDIHFQLRVNISGIMDKMIVNDLWFDMGFKGLTGEAENAEINGQPTDFSQIAQTIQTLFDTLWNEENKYKINAQIWCNIKHAVRDCNALELINLIYWCLDAEPNAQCKDATNPPTVPTTPYVSPSSPGNTDVTSEATTPDTSDAVTIHKGSIIAIISAIYMAV